MIYMIYNTINDKKYIGSTTRSIERRLGDHKYKALKGYKDKLHTAMRELGVNNFYIKLVTTTTTTNRINKELYYIRLYDTVNNGYNTQYRKDYRR